MSYDIELAHIPAGNLGTIVLAGCALSRSYGVKIGLVACALPMQWRTMTQGYEFTHLRLEYPIGEASIFDLGPAPSVIKTAKVIFSEPAEFANGTEEIFKSFDLKTVLRTILPHDGGISVLQLMVQRSGQSIGLKLLRDAELYTSTIYEVIGGPLVEDNKSDA